jgi:hypothetical protein
MSTPPNDLLGVSYVDGEFFLANANAFGCARALQSLYSGTVVADTILPILSAASRMIDAEVGRDFISGEIRENHKLELNTRRIKINKPPLQTLLSYKLRTGAGLVSNFTVTPVQTDGENNVSFGAIYYNRQENYLELSSLAMASSMTSQLVSLGLSEPQIEIVYTSFADVPKEVVTATCWLAAHLLNESATSSVIAQGLASFKADDVEVRRQTNSSSKGSRDDALPLIVKQLLRSVTRIAVA